VSELFQVPDKPPVVEDLNLLVQRARQGDETVLPQLRDMMDTRPEIWQHFGNLAGHAREAWLRLISADDLALKESTARKSEDLMRELAGPEPTVVERLLAERAVLCWLQLHHADSLAAQTLMKSTQLADFWCKRQSSAHRRYLTSLAALVTLRRLLPCTSGGALDASRLDSSIAVSERDDVRQVDPEHRLRVVGKPK
jgi:hypothetical protein